MIAGGLQNERGTPSALFESDRSDVNGDPEGDSGSPRSESSLGESTAERSPCGRTPEGKLLIPAASSPVPAAFNETVFTWAEWIFETYRREAVVLTPEPFSCLADADGSDGHSSSDPELIVEK